MKVLYGEGVANHTSPELCVLGREAGIEALTGEHVGWVLSREEMAIGDADAVLTAEGHTRIAGQAGGRPGDLPVPCDWLGHLIWGNRWSNAAKPKCGG